MHRGLSPNLAFRVAPLRKSFLFSNFTKPRKASTWNEGECLWGQVTPLNWFLQQTCSEYSSNTSRDYYIYSDFLWLSKCLVDEVTGEQFLQVIDGVELKHFQPLQVVRVNLASSHLMSLDSTPW